MWRTPSQPPSHVAVAITLNAQASSLKKDLFSIDRVNGMNLINIYHLTQTCYSYYVTVHRQLMIHNDIPCLTREWQRLVIHWWTFQCILLLNKENIQWLQTPNPPQLTLVTSNKFVFTFDIFNPVTTRNDKVGYNTALRTTPVQSHQSLIINASTISVSTTLSFCLIYVSRDHSRLCRCFSNVPQRRTLADY